MSVSPSKQISLLLEEARESSSSCLLDNKQITKITPFGDASLYGDISLIEIGPSSKKAVLKKIPLAKQNPDDLTTAIGVEIKMQELVTQLVDLGICNHFSPLSEKSVCKKCSYANPNLPKKPTSCLTTVSPFSDSGSMKGFLSKLKKRRGFNDRDISISYFQVFAGLYAMQYFFNASHHDMHIGNVFLTKNEDYMEGAYEMYRIAGQNYYVPSHPFTFQIADFGFARIPKKLEIKSLEEFYKEPAQMQRLSADYTRFASMLWQVSLDVGQDEPRSDYIRKILNICFENYKLGSPIADVIPVLFSEFIDSASPNAKIVKYWDLESSIADKIDPMYKPYLASGKKDTKKIISSQQFADACKELLTDPKIFQF